MFVVQLGEGIDRHDLVMEQRTHYEQGVQAHIGVIEQDVQRCPTPYVAASCVLAQSPAVVTQQLRVLIFKGHRQDVGNQYTILHHCKHAVSYTHLTLPTKRIV